MDKQKMLALLNIFVDPTSLHVVDQVSKYKTILGKHGKC